MDFLSEIIKKLINQKILTIKRWFISQKKVLDFNKFYFGAL